jgi:hypothetical protein
MRTHANENNNKRKEEMKSNIINITLFLIIITLLSINSILVLGEVEDGQYKCVKAHPTYCTQNTWLVDARLNITEQEILARETVNNFGFSDAYCQKRAQNYYCASFLPVCHDNNPSQPVCLDVCQEFVDDCSFSNRDLCRNAVGDPCSGNTIRSSGNPLIAKGNLVLAIVIAVIASLL